uniref:Uncharacterized protein n=1 Tax=Parascaris equorum TaxID=6256 RepID=A0A914R753_PAREQ
MGRGVRERWLFNVLLDMMKVAYLPPCENPSSQLSFVALFGCLIPLIFVDMMTLAGVESVKERLDAGGRMNVDNLDHPLEVEIVVSPVGIRNSPPVFYVILKESDMEDDVKLEAMLEEHFTTKKPTDHVEVSLLLSAFICVLRAIACGWN